MTSAQNNSGIDEFFYNIGNKYLDPNFQEKINLQKNENNQEKVITLDAKDVKEKDKEKKKKKGFC